MKLFTRFVSLVLVFAFLIGIAPFIPLQTHAEEDWRAWAQSDSRWGSLPLGRSSETMSSAGCLITSLAKVMVQSGLVDPDEFDPGTLVTKLNAIHTTSDPCFTSGGGFYWKKAEKVLDGFFLEDYSYALTGTSSACEAGLMELVRAEYHILLNVGGHYVAVDNAASLAGNEIYIMDSLRSSQNADVRLKDRYSYIYQVALYSGWCETPDGAYIRDFCTEKYNCHLNVTTSVQTELWSMPCTDEISAEAQVLATAEAGGVYTADRIYKNSEGDYWYRVRNGSQICYLFSGDTAKGERIAVTPVTADLVTPDTVTEGSSFNLGGTISSPNLPFGEVGAYIYRGTQAAGDIHMMSLDTSGPFYSFNIRSSPVNQSLKFGQLTAGTYTYLMTVVYDLYCATGNRLSHTREVQAITEKVFTVVGTETAHDPEGLFESASGGENQVHVAGWAFDRSDVSQALEILVYVGGTQVGTLTADQERTDLNETYPGVGSFHGFAGTLAVPEGLTGEQEVEVIARNILEGSDVSLGKKTVAIGNAEQEDHGDTVASGACGDQGGNVTWMLYSDGTLVISGSGAMADYAQASPPWLEYCDSIKTVRIDQGVTAVGEYAFWFCTALSGAVISEGITSIGEGAFYACAELKQVTLPQSLTSIGVYAFGECVSLTTVSIPKNVAAIGDYAFSWCTELTAISVSGDNPAYSSDAQGVLFDKTGEKLIQVPGAMTGSYWLPDTVTEITDYAFFGCSRLTEIVASDSNAAYSSDDAGVLFDKSGETLVQVPGGLSGDYAIPQGVTTIDGAFYGCANVTGVTIPASVRTISESSFAYCTSLTDVYYEGTQAQWNAMSIGSHNDALLDAQLHIIGTTEKIYDIRYFYSWNENEQRIYFGPDDTLGCLVTEETDSGFRDNPTLFLRRYVIVESKTVDGEEVLLDLILPFTQMGVVTAVSGDEITIDGTVYDIPANLSSPGECLNKTVVYHLADGVLAGVDVLREEEGYLTYWHTGGQLMRLQTDEKSDDSEVYQLSAIAEETSGAFLDWSVMNTDGSTTDVPVSYFADENHAVFRILPRIAYRDGGFSEEKHGWSVPNHHAGFGYPDPYYIEPWLWYAHGDSASKIDEAANYRTQTWEWGGSCFGMCMLAVAQYHGDVDLKPYFSRSGSTLMEFGYDAVVYDATWFSANLYALYQQDATGKVSNDAVLRAMEQAQVAQLADIVTENMKYTVDGEDYAELIAYLNGENPVPLVVTMKQPSHHAVVTDTSMKPIYIGNQRYLIPLYDPNAPEPAGQLNAALWVYHIPQSMLLLDTGTGEWGYVYNGALAGGRMYPAGNMEVTNSSGEVVRKDVRLSVFDFSKATEADPLFFDGHYAYDSEQVTIVYGNRFGKILEIYSADSSTGKRTKVFELVDGVPTFYGDAEKYLPYFEALEDDSGMDKGSVTLPMGSYIIKTDGEAYLQFMYDNHIFVAQADRGIELGLDTDNDRMTIVAAEDGSNISGIHASSEVDFATSVEAVMDSADALTLSADTESKTAEVTTTVDADSVAINHAVDGELTDVTQEMVHTYEVIVTEPTCETQGYTTYTCTDCGESFVSAYTDPVDHVYEDGQCKWCGKVQAYAKFTTISTSLGGNIAMNFYLELSEDLVSDPDAYIQFTFADRTIHVPLSQGVLLGNTYRYSCPITSKNMTDDITAQVFNASGPVGASKTMAVDTYCNWVIENYKDEKTVNLMKAMLNYGAAAQLLFKYRNDDLANAALAEADKVLGKVAASAYVHSRTGEEEGIKPTSYTLLLDSETTVRVYFQLTGSKTIEEYTFTVDGVEVEPVYKDGLYYIQKTDIGAHRLDDLHVFTCGDITIRYGGLSYVNQVMTYYESGTTFDMASALYAYSKAAEAYIG